MACAVGVHGKHGCSNHHGCGGELEVPNTGEILPDGSDPIPDGKVPFREHDLVTVYPSNTSDPGNKSTAAPSSSEGSAEPPLSLEKKCLDAAGEPVWCSSASSVGEASDVIDANHHNKSTAAPSSSEGPAEPPLSL